MENWAGNVVFGAREVYRPGSIARLQETVAGHDRVHAVGAGHSFSRVADTTGALVSVDALPEVLEVAPDRETVRVSAGMRLGDLAARLHRRGLALRNLPSLPQVSVAGACATATHGSGASNTTLSGAVGAIELVTADGSLVTLSRGAAGSADDAGSADFDGAIVALGALGIVTALRLDICPAFDVEQYVYEGLAFDSFLAEFGAIAASAYSVSVFTGWTGPVRLWVKRRAGDEFRDLAWTGARPADGPRHVIEGMPPGPCTPQLGVPGPWYERLPHFRPDFTPSAGDELQSEYLVPAEYGVDALRALEALHDWIAPVLHVSEIRTVAPDTCWLSPAYRRGSVAVHFTWLPDQRAVTPVLARIEGALAPFHARPHWGKLFGTPPEALAARYPRWPDFRDLRRRFDPAGTFRNELIEAYFPN